MAALISAGTLGSVRQTGPLTFTGLLYWIPMLAGKKNTLWSELQGQAIEDFALGEIIGASETCAIYATKLRDESPAAIKVRLADSAEEDLRHSQWSAASGLSHPNLIRVYSTGTSEISGVPVEYMVMERADETLAGALVDRPLSGSELRELLAPTLAAIAYLHQNRFLHGSLHPSNVLGVQDTLKLSCDNLIRVGEAVPARPASQYDPPEAYTGPASPAWDSWSIGALLLHSGTLQHPEIRDGKVEFSGLEQPFDAIARHTLVIEPEQRWNAAQIIDAFEGKPVVPPVTRALPALPRSQSNGGSFERPARVIATRSAAPAPVPEQTKGRPGWLVPAIALGVVAVLLLVWTSFTPRSTTSVQPPVAAPQTVAPAPASSAPTAAVAPALPAQPTTPVAAATTVRKAAATSKGWYVVVATYADKGGAEKRARAITSRWPRFRAQVFDPPAHDSHHLVVIGSRISEDEAAALRDRARAAGLPRDVYIKKF